LLVTDVSELPIGPVFKGQAFTFKDRTDNVSRNVAKIANLRPPRRKSENTQAVYMVMESH